MCCEGIERADARSKAGSETLTPPNALIGNGWKHAVWMKVNEILHSMDGFCSFFSGTEPNNDTAYFKLFSPAALLLLGYLIQVVRDSTINSPYSPN